MELDLAQLRALAAAVDEGTLEAAARAMHVTPSAVSQRLKALEIATGQVLLVRSKPVRATPSGKVVLRLARQVDALAADTARELGAAPDPARPASVALAVNADSLGTWVLPALAALEGSVAVDLRLEDQDHTSALLRAGTVMAAVTADAAPVPGCTATRLGRMRYRPMAAPGLAARWFPDGPSPAALARAPMVVFDRKDDLQHRYLRARLGAGAAAPPAHFVPASAEFLQAVLLGLGWGMLPDLQSEGPAREGRLVAIDAEGVQDVDLHWQQWRLRSPTLDRVAAAILEAASAHLR
jgi:LysR family transcriptional regulator, chromosome initiation inhibitor